MEEAVTPAGQEASRPLVSAIVPRDDDASVAETLESVRRSTMRSWEILVGDAAAERARSELLLVLDPGSLIRPFGMARLVAALIKDPGADLAYGLVDRRDAGEPAAVLDKFGWDLQRLQRESYIEPPVLIRRRVLFELGGYSEGSDLWQQLAASGHRATFVRQFVGSRCRSAAAAAA
jgi:hypothetical protein